MKWPLCIRSKPYLPVFKFYRRYAGDVVLWELRQITSMGTMTYTDKRVGLYRSRFLAMLKAARVTREARREAIAEAYS